MAPKRSGSKTKPPPSVAADAPTFTQENFEKELQALASKAKEDTTGRWAKEQLSVFVRAGTLLTLAAIYSNLSQLTLAPVYGGIPSSIWHSKGVMTACFVGWSANLFLRRQLPLKPIKLLPLVAAYIPLIQFFAFKASDILGPKIGPAATEALTFLPLLVLSVSCTATELDDLELTSGNNARWILDAAPGITSYMFYKCVEYYSRSFIWKVIGKTLITSLVGLQLLMTGIYSVLAPSKLLRYAIPALLHTTMLNTHFQAPWTTSSLNSTLLASDWKIIDRQDSNTGLISVIENSKDKFRAMRCDHSLLGGEWLLDTKGPVGEPIYGIFVMLEAIRLIERPNPVEDTQANALVMYVSVFSCLVSLADISPVVLASAQRPQR